MDGPSPHAWGLRGAIAVFLSDQSAASMPLFWNPFILLIRTACEDVLSSGLMTHRPSALVDLRSPMTVAGSELGGCWPGDLGFLATQLPPVNPVPWSEKRSQTFLSQWPNFPRQCSSAVTENACACVYVSEYMCGGGRKGKQLPQTPITPLHRVCSVWAGAYLLGLFLQ